MNPEIFEVIMLVCFGASWPFSISKTLREKDAHGKSLVFLSIVLAGYISGVLFNYFGKRNYVIFVYLFNACLVTTDLFLTMKYTKAKKVENVF